MCVRLEAPAPYNTYDKQSANFAYSETAGFYPGPLLGCLSRHLSGQAGKLLAVTRSLPMAQRVQSGRPILSCTIGIGESAVDTSLPGRFLQSCMHVPRWQVTVTLVSVAFFFTPCLGTTRAQSFGQDSFQLGNCPVSQHDSHCNRHHARESTSTPDSRIQVGTENEYLLPFALPRTQHTGSASAPSPSLGGTWGRARRSG
jgi:hypothetical protein